MPADDSIQNEMATSITDDFSSLFDSVLVWWGEKTTAKETKAIPRGKPKVFDVVELWSFMAGFDSYTTPSAR